MPVVARAASSARVVHFPPRSVGMLRLQAKNKYPYTFLAKFSFSGGAIPAQGAITVPPGYRLLLFVNPAACSDLNFLKQLRPDDLDGISFDQNSNGMPLSDESFAQAIAHLDNLRGLSLRDTDITDRSIAAIGKLHDLEVLDISRTMITPASVSQLAELRNLRSLSIDHNQLRGTDWSWLLRLKNLSEIDIKYDGLTDKDLVALSQLKIGSIAVGNPGLTDRGLRHLSHIKSLVAIEIAKECVLSGQTIDALTSSLPLVHVFRGTLDSLDEHTADCLTRWNRMTLLDVRSGPMSDAAARKLAGFPKAEGIFITATPKQVAFLRSKLPHCEVESNAGTGALGFSKKDAIEIFRPFNKALEK